MSAAALFAGLDTPSWADLERNPPAGDQERGRLAATYAHLFGGLEGERVLDDLRRYLMMAVPPEMGDAYLRHVEGQRAMVRYILTMIERGRAV